MARIHEKLDAYDEAERLYLLGADTFPQDLIWTKGLARVYLSRRDEQRLTATLRKIAEQEPDNETFARKLTQLALARRDFADAEKWANRALHVNVRNAAVHAQLAEALAGQGRDQQAADEYKTALRIQPQQTAWRLAMAQALVRSQEHEMARAVLDDLLRRTPNHREAQQLLEQLSDD